MDKKRMYFAGIQLPDSINEVILKIKKDFDQRFNSRHAMRSPAHITLQPPFFADAAQLLKVKASLADAVSQTNPFLITLKGFSKFKGVIFIHVISSESLQNCKEKVSHAFSEFGFKQDTRSFHPHVTVAFRDLSPENFRFAWSEYSIKKFDASFNTQSLTLYKLTDGGWEIETNFPFARTH